MSQIVVQGPVATLTHVEPFGIKLLIAEIKTVEYLVGDGSLPPPEGWEVKDGVARGPMKVMGDEIVAFITAERADELGDALKKAAQDWRHTFGTQ